MNETIGPKQPRLRRLLIIVAMVVPVALFGSAAAWFVHAHVLQRTMVAYKPLTLAPPETASLAEPSRPRAETTGSAVSSEPRATLPMLASLAVAPAWRMAAAPPRIEEAPAPKADVSADALEPIADTIPLPVPRPRISAAAFRRPVPLPRPRPTTD